MFSRTRYLTSCYYFVDQRTDWKAETRVIFFQGPGRDLITSGSFSNINVFLIILLLVLCSLAYKVKLFGTCENFFYP